MSEHSDASEKTARVRNAAASKAAILNSALRAFTRRSYDEVGLREIATEAQIDPALIIRYFGSKEGLFREVLGTLIHLDGLTGVEAKDFPQALASLIWADPESTSQRAMLILHLSASSDVAGPLIRQHLVEHLVKPMASRLSIPNAEVRVEVALATLGGLCTGRHITKYPQMSAEDSAWVNQYVTPMLRQLLTNE